MSGWFFLASSIVQYQLKIKLFNSIKKQKNNVSVDQKTRPNICFKTYGQAFEKLGRAFETLSRAFKILGRAFEDLREN